ncbi:hypothetical protein Plhal703r1_c19g0087961 [Plasmopara halstedii]
MRKIHLLRQGRHIYNNLSDLISPPATIICFYYEIVRDSAPQKTKAALGSSNIVDKEPITKYLAILELDAPRELVDQTMQRFLCNTKWKPIMLMQFKGSDANARSELLQRAYKSIAGRRG